jgi:uncharacterized iron-regulated protein
MMPNRRCFAAMLLMLTLLGCAQIPRIHDAPPQSDTPPQSDAVLLQRLAQADVLLLGEVHDNVVQHRRRLDWLQQLALKRRLVLLMEQLDADAQPAIAAARQALKSVPEAGQDLDRAARAIASAGGFRFDGWDWSLYGPVIRWAIRQGVELRGANLSSAQTMAIARGQAHRLADQRPPGWGETQEAALAALIREGHCGLLPERMIVPMVRAQRARDARMAEAVTEAIAEAVGPAEGPPPALAESSASRSLVAPLVILLAGNGHVRSDVGVPVHLAERLPSARLVSLGLLEQGNPDRAAFDEVIATQAQTRQDPCQALRQRFGAAG